jgi:hypothetical protein
LKKELVQNSVTWSSSVGGEGQIVDRKIVIIAVILSVIGSAAYPCSLGLAPMHPLCQQIAFIGMPGILAAAVLTIAGLGSHGGGPLGMLLVIATPVNFLLYLSLGAAAKRLAKMFKFKKRLDPGLETDSTAKNPTPD